MRRRAFWPALALSLVARAAAAQEAQPSLDLRGFTAPTDPKSGLYLEPASSPGTGEWNAGLWTHYALRPVVLRDADGERVFDVIGHQVTGDLTVNVGFFERAALGIDLPYLIYQTGDEPTIQSTRVLGDDPLPSQSLGDLALVGKFTVIPPTNREFGGFALALHERFTVPTGDEASYLGEGHLTSITRLLAEYRLVALSAHLSLGVKFRAEKERFACADLPEPEDSSDDPCSTLFGHELPWGLGIAVRPQAFGIDEEGRWLWFLEAHGHLPIAPRSLFDEVAVSEAQLALGARYSIKDFSILAGVEAALAGGVGNPAFRGTLSVSWAPRLHDKDEDGVEDKADSCEELAEDLDGFDDADGCPELDNDDDGVPDADDKCVEKEDEDGHQDQDGCPDKDNDGDGVEDSADACPDDKGEKTANPKTSGCPVRDMDGDGIEAEKDKCPEQPEDKDSFQDDDGCPEDDDGDGIPDAEDACKDQKGDDNPDPKQKGCPNADKDADTFGDPEDKCPAEAEAFNGIDDADGCPDGDPASPDPRKKGKPQVLVREVRGATVVELVAALKFTATHEVDPASVPLVRALAQKLLAEPSWSLAVGVRPYEKYPEKDAQARAKSVVELLRKHTRKQTVADVAPWDQVRAQPSAEAHGVGFKLLGAAPPKAPAPETQPPAKPAAPKPPAPPPPAKPTTPTSPPVSKPPAPAKGADPPKPPPPPPTGAPKAPGTAAPKAPPPPKKTP